MNKNIIAQYLFVFIFILISISSISSAQNQQLQLLSILKSIQQKYAPDSRLAVFNISFKDTQSGFVLYGEVDNPKAKNAVLHSFGKKTKRAVLDSIRILPEAELGSKTFGIVILDVANVHSGPDKQKELINQALMGTIVKLFKKTDGYYFIKTPDQYLGWLDTGSVHITNQQGIIDWKASPRVIVTSSSGIANKKPDVSSTVLCDLVEGCILKYFGSKDGWTSVELADGKKGFVMDTLVQDFNDWSKTRSLSGENLEKTAKSFLGIPYLWGGTSTRGMDCSGFAKTVYFLNGFELSRDANQQARQGKHIDPGKIFQNVKKGDLLFFGRKASKREAERITHVAIYLENGLFIHSSHNVHYSSFNPMSKYYDEALTKIFVRARRIFKK